MPADAEPRPGGDERRGGLGRGRAPVARARRRGHARAVARRGERRLRVLLLGRCRPARPLARAPHGPRRTSRWTCGRSSGPASSTRSWPATRRGRPRTRAWAATATSGWTRCSSSPTGSVPPRLATGHYARVTEDGLLRTAADPAKDQAYMLAALAPESVARMQFPLAELTKPEVRAIAAAAELPVASRADSQDLCFLAGVGKARFLARHGGLEDAPGEIVSTDRRRARPPPRHAPLHRRPAQGPGRAGGRAGVRAAHRVRPRDRWVAGRARDRSRGRPRRPPAPSGRRSRRSSPALPRSRGRVPCSGLAGCRPPQTARTATSTSPFTASPPARPLVCSAAT